MYLTHLRSLSIQPPQPHDVTATFVEVIGTVVDASTIKLLTSIDMGSKLGELSSLSSRNN